MKIIWFWKSFNALTGAEMHELLALRQQVFSVEQNCIYVDPDEFDKESIHLLGKNDSGLLVAYARLVLPETKYPEPSIGRVLNRAEVRGLGVGKALMTEAIRYSLREFPGQDIKIMAQAYLERFYSELGFKTISEPFLEDGIEHINMLFTAPSKAS